MGTRATIPIGALKSGGKEYMKTMTSGAFAKAAQELPVGGRLEATLWNAEPGVDVTIVALINYPNPATTSRQERSETLIHSFNNPKEGPVVISTVTDAKGGFLMRREGKKVQLYRFGS